MKDKYSFDRMLMHLDLSGEAPPGVPIIEIIGNSRILIENQVGICNYCKSSVVVLSPPWAYASPEITWNCRR